MRTLARGTRRLLRLVIAGVALIAAALSRRLVLAAVVLAAGVFAGTLTANATDGARPINACVNNANGAMRAVADTADCRRNEHALSWNREGAPGPQGAEGPAGTVASIDDLQGTPCNTGAGFLSVNYQPSGAVDLTCVSTSPPPTTTSTIPPGSDVPPGAPGAGPGPDCLRAPAPCTGPGCGDLVAFNPREGDGYDDYPINGETADNQYRSFLRRDAVAVVQYAAALVACKASAWTSGHGAPIGLGDMSEADGSIPGTATGEPGHPGGTHTNGLDIDVAYFQHDTSDNRLRAVCPHDSRGVEQNHCTAAPDRLDVWRTALFVAALSETGQVRVIGVDGAIGPLLQSALTELCRLGWTQACQPVPLAFEVTDGGSGWFSFHHHNMHVSFTAR